MGKRLEYHGVVRYYYNLEGDYCPYSGLLHDSDDEPVKNFSDTFENLLGEFDDGSEVIITIEDKGSRAKGKWKLIEPHIYGKVDSLDE